MTFATAVEIAGRVIDGVTGHPVAGAAIWRRPGEQTRSGPAGAFALRAWLHEGRAQIGIAADGYAPTSATVTTERLESANGVDGLDIVLAPAALLGGQVVDAVGRPIAGASLWIEPTGRRGVWRIGPGAGNAVSAADGSFFLAGVESGQPYRLNAAATGYAPGTLAIPATPDGSTREPVRVALTRGQLVHGVVADNRGVPIPGAEVALLPVAATGDGGYSWNHAARKTISTDARGAFEFAHTAPGRHELTASHPDRVSVEALAFEVPQAEGTKDVGTIMLDVGAAVEGVVRDFRRRPVAGAQVSVFQVSIDHRRSFEPVVRTAVTEADGAFRVDGLRAQPADLVVEAEGHERFEMAAVDPQAGRLFEVRLGQGARLVGRVLDASGDGVAHASIWLRPDHGPGLGRRAWSPRAHGHQTTTDGHGRFRFRFESLGAGPWSVEVGGERLAEDIGSIRLQPDEEREIELRLRGQGRLAGVVTDPYGDPVAGAEIIVQTLDPAGRLTSTRHGARTDAGGTYEVHRVPSGRAQLIARHPDYRDGVVEVSIERGMNEVDFQLQPGMELAGAVATADGAPVAFARVEAHPVESGSLGEPGSAQRQLVARAPSEAFTDQEGTWRISGLDDGRYNLRAHADGYARAASGPFALHAGRRSVVGIDFVLQRGIHLQGVVTGLPPEALAGIRITASQEGLRGGMTSPDLEGRFELAELGSGTWTVSAQKRNGRTVERSVFLETGPGEAFVELNFEPGLTLTGEVRIQLQPLAGGEVYMVEGTPGHGAARTARTARTARINQQGRFRIEGLEAGSFRVLVAESNGAIHSRQIEVLGNHEVFIDLTPPAVLAGTVVDRATREPLSGAHIIAIGADSEAGYAPGAEEAWVPAGSTESNARGEYRLEFVPGETTSLLVQREGYGTFRLPLDLVPGERRGGFPILLEPDVAAPP